MQHAIKLCTASLLVLALFCAGAGKSKAQLWIGLGGQAGYMNLPGANLPVDYFNNKGFNIRNYREWHWPRGLIYALGYRDDDLLVELNLNTRQDRIAAEIAGGNAISRRENRFGLQSLTATVGGAVVSQEDFLFFLCGALDLGYMRYRTRTGSPETINRANYFTVNRQGFLGLTVSFRFTFRQGEDDPTHWTLGPYVQLPFARFDFQRFNQTININDWQAVTGDVTARPVNFGVSLQFDLDLLELIQ